MTLSIAEPSRGGPSLAEGRRREAARAALRIVAGDLRGIHANAFASASNWTLRDLSWGVTGGISRSIPSIR